MRLLITGGAGFLGSHLADHFLAQGHKVIVIDYDAEGADPDEVEQVPQGEDGETEDATISVHEVGVLFKPVAEFLKQKAGDA